MIQHVKSADGTLIAIESFGAGEPLIVLGGALSTRAAVQPFVPFLEDAFTVFGVDRRGRGDSGDTAPYAVEREVEDVAAIVEAAGEPVKVYGHSSGAVLALEAAAAGVPISGLLACKRPSARRRNQGKAGTSSRLGSVNWLRRGSVATPSKPSCATPGFPSIRRWKQEPWWPGVTAVAHTPFL